MCVYILYIVIVIGLALYATLLLALFHVLFTIIKDYITTNYILHSIIYAMPYLKRIINTSTCAHAMHLNLNTHTQNPVRRGLGLDRQQVPAAAAAATEQRHRLLGAQNVGQLLLVGGDRVRIGDALRLARQLQRVQVLQFGVGRTAFDDLRENLLQSECQCVCKKTARVSEMSR